MALEDEEFDSGCESTVLSIAALSTTEGCFDFLLAVPLEVTTLEYTTKKKFYGD
jgi:hypothetical protein